MSSTSTACSSKIIEIEMDPPPSLSVSVIASSGSGYRLIGISILADVFMILSSSGFYGIQCFNLCDISEKRKNRQDICNLVALSVFITTHFSPQNRLIY